ncbi:MAG TPA: ribonuclease III [Porticoccus sp.]|nr:ribonuclease III [Porticoccus sp.]
MQITKQRFLNRIGYQFNDHALLELALTHRSCSSSNNERLEFLGDAALNFIIGHAIYQRLPDIREGELSRYRSSLVKGVTLTEVANELQLSEHLHLGAGEIKSGGHRRASILADTVEAIIGAIYLDGGMPPCEKSVLQWFESRLENLNDQGLKDPKTQLQEFMQSSGSPLPVYEVVGVSGVEHNQQFTVHCRVDGLKKPTIGCGSSRRHAEKQAAELALKGLIA